MLSWSMSAGRATAIASTVDRPDRTTTWKDILTVRSTQRPHAPVATSYRKNIDLSQYTTPNFADDIDEVRGAMGYDKININAGSFGTYAAQIYMRRHGEHVRSAYLSSPVTLPDRVPLYSRPRSADRA